MHHWIYHSKHWSLPELISIKLKLDQQPSPGNYIPTTIWLIQRPPSSSASNFLLLTYRLWCAWTAWIKHHRWQVSSLHLRPLTPMHVSVIRNMSLITFSLGNIWRVYNNHCLSNGELPLSCKYDIMPSVYYLHAVVDLFVYSCIDYIIHD